MIEVVGLRELRLPVRDSCLALLGHLITRWPEPLQNLKLSETQNPLGEELWGLDLCAPEKESPGLIIGRLRARRFQESVLRVLCRILQSMRPTVQLETLVMRTSKKQVDDGGVVTRSRDMTVGVVCLDTVRSTVTLDLPEDAIFSHASHRPGWISSLASMVLSDQFPIAIVRIETDIAYAPRHPRTRKALQQAAELKKEFRATVEILQQNDVSLSWGGLEEHY